MRCRLSIAFAISAFPPLLLDAAFSGLAFSALPWRCVRFCSLTLISFDVEHITDDSISRRY